jgi:small subunit ribosomal protein S18
MDAPHTIYVPARFLSLQAGNPIRKGAETMQHRRDSGMPGAPGPLGSAPGGLSGERSGPPGRPGGRGRDFRSRRKVCQFCVDHVREIDYKDVARLRRYLSDRGKIEPRRKTGTCAKHQRRLSVALKNARFMAMLPYTAVHIRGA